MTKLFITGSTGYIGGDALYAIANTYPDLQITALVRNSDKGAKVAAQYASIRLVYGDLDSTDLITSESSKADIVVHTADCDHASAAHAIIAGLAQNPQPTYLIHTSGTGILSYEDFNTGTYGLAREKTFNDWDGITELTSLPDSALHRNVDKIILSAASISPSIKTAIVCPPCIYGPGRGPDNQRSVQIYDMAKAVLTRHKGFVVGDGKNVWHSVHVHDLSALFLALVTAALEGADRSAATWNSEGYYFAENGEFVWGEVAEQITKIAAEKKLVNSSEVDRLGKEEADALRPPVGSYLWGTNSRGQAVRAGKLLGWKPKGESLRESLPGIVEGEARRLGLLKGHAALAAGEGQL